MRNVKVENRFDAGRYRVAMTRLALAGCMTGRNLVWRFAN
jgi:hypothetical protein